jgi:hypothetical protein
MKMYATDSSAARRCPKNEVETKDLGLVNLHIFEVTRSPQTSVKLCRELTS